MDMSFNLYILSSNDPEVHAVNIYKDDKDKNGYAIIDSTNVSLDLLKVIHLRDYVCSIKGVGDSDKNNLKFWKVIGVKSKDIKSKIFYRRGHFTKTSWRRNGLKDLFSTYFQDELDDKINLEVPSSPSSPPLVSVSQHFTARTRNLQ